MSFGEGVEFSSLCREWRGKWSKEDSNSSLISVNQLFVETFLPTLKSIDGFQKVQRIVCGGMLDWKFGKRSLLFCFSFPVLESCQP